MSYRTHTKILYMEAGSKFMVEIPAGTPAIRATHLPREAYLAQPWPSISKTERDYLDQRGYILMSAEVCQELPLSGA